MKTLLTSGPTRAAWSNPIALLGLCLGLSGGVGRLQAVTLQTGDILVSDVGNTAANTTLWQVPVSGTPPITPVVLSKQGTGSGSIDLVNLSAAASATVVYYHDPNVSSGAILQVDPATGNRTEISSGTTAPQLTNANMLEMVWDPVGGQILINYGGVARGIVKVNVSTGVRSYLTGNGVGGGTAAPTSNIRGLAVAASGTIYMYDQNGLVSVDRTTGDRTLVSAAGNFVTVASPGGLGYDDFRGLVLVSDLNSNATTAAIKWVSSGGVITVATGGTASAAPGSGTPFDTPRFPIADSSGNLYYLETAGTGAKNIVKVASPGASNVRSVYSAGASYLATSGSNLTLIRSAAPPTVTTGTATSVVHTSATLGGDVTSDGGSTVTERGVVYATSANPTTSNSKASTSGTTGAFTVGVTGLTAGTTYHFRAYAINGNGTSYGSDTTFSTIPTATELRFTTQPSGSTSGSALSGQPVVKATDALGNVDTTFTGNVTLALNTGAGSLSGTLTKAAVAGIATFTNVAYTATADQQSFTLATSNSSSLTNATSSAVTSDVVATVLQFSTQPVPTGLQSGVATAFSTVPVVRAVNSGGFVDTGYATAIVLSVTDPNDGTVDGTVNALSGTGDTDGAGTTVTLTPASGVATFTGLALTYTNSGASNSIALRATSGGLTSANSSTITSITDTTPPTIGSISIPDAPMKIGDQVTVTINVTGDTDNYTTGSGGISGSVGGFALGALARGSNTQYTAKFTVTSGGANVAAGADIPVNFTLTDSAGNTSAAFTTAISQGSDAIDANRPTAAIVVADTALKAGETSLVTITFSEAVTGFTNADLTIANGTLTAVSSSDGGTTWTATLTPTASLTDATNVITLANTGVADAAGNAGTGTTDSNNYAIDTARPTATIVVADTALKAGETSLVTITFSEAVTGFTNADLTIANGTLTAVSSSDGGTTWTATLTPTASLAAATNVITLDNTGVADAAGNAGTGTTDSNNYAIDTARPTATIVAADTALKAGETSLVTITFSEAVTGFTNADLTIANGTLTAVSSSDGGTTWTATFTPTASLTDATNVITLDNTGVADAAGNAGTGTTDSNNYAIDTARPTATIVVTDSALGVGETSLVTITFSEAVTGFTNADLTIANGTLTAVSSSDGGTTWTATFTPTASLTDATNVITLDNTGVADAAGNAGTGITDSNNYAIDNVRPTATIVVTDTALKAGETSLVTITFSETVSGFTNADLTIANGTLTAVSSSDGGTTWTATLTPTASVTDATNVITLDNTGVADATGNAGTGTTDSNNYAIDTARPTATIVVTDTALKVGETSLVTITFSEAVTGFTNADLTIANGALTAVASSDGGTTWTATLTPTASVTDGTNVITLDNTGVADAAGNAGTGTTDSNNYAIDNVRPTATIVVADTALKVGETSLVTITFSEAVTGFTNADLTIANGTLTAVSSSDGGTTWTATLTPTAGVTDATNVITLDNTGVVDAAGNAGTGTTDSNNYAIDTDAPTTTVATGVFSADTGSSTTDLVTFTAAQTISGTLSANLAAGEIVEVSLDSGATWVTAATAVGTNTWSLAGQTLTASNTLKVRVSDTAGNSSSPLSRAYVLDTIAPNAPTAVTLTPVGGTVAANALNGTNTNLTASATIAAAQATGGKAELYVGATLIATDSSIGGADVSVTFDLGLSTTTALQAALSAGGTASVKLYDLAGNSATSSVANPALVVDYVGPSAPTALTLTPVGGTVVANTLNGTNTSLTASATITAAEATGGKAELYLGATLAATDNSIAAADTSVAFDVGTSTTAALQLAVTAGGVATVKLYDAAGNSATSSVANPTLTIDYAAPAAPSTPDLDVASDTGSSGTDNITSVTGPTFTGTAEANSTVKLYEGATLLGSATATGGNWTITSSALAQGSHNIKATATDAAANVSADSGVLAVTIDTTAPTLQTILRQTPATVNTNTVTATWRVTFQEGVTGVNASDFVLTVLSGTPSGTITGVTPVSTSVYDVAVGSIAGQGRLRVDLKATGAGIADLAGNALADGGFTSGDFYYVGVDSVFDSIRLATGTTRSVSNATTGKVAQRFTTAAAVPLSLTTVTAALGAITGTPTPVVTIHADNAGAINPTVVTTLTNPASLAANGVNVWTSTALLSASTTYWVVFADTSVAGAYEIKETAATTGGSGAWLTNPDYVYRYGANAGTGPQAGALQIAIGATSVPSITSTLTAGGTYKTAFTYTITATNLPTSYAASGLPTGLNLNAGTGVVTGAATQTGSFNVSLTATNGSGTGAPSTLVLTVAKAPLTVTARDAERQFGVPNPSFAVNYTGFLGGDSAASLTTTPTAATTATASSPVGTYPITATSGVSPNYSFSYVSGTLDVVKAEQGISFVPLPDVLIGQSLVLSATADSGLPVAFAVVAGPAALAGGTLLATGAGSITVRASQGGDSNFLSAVTESSFVASAGTPTLTTPTHAAEPPAGGTAVLAAETNNPNLTYQWQRNGVALGGATQPTLTLNNVQPPVAGLYTYTATLPGGGSGSSEPVIVGLTTTEKVIGAAEQIGTNIVHPNGNIYDQLLLEGPATTFTADPGQITRLSFVDLSDDIVQVEFSGAGSVSLVMDGASAPAAAANYNQPGVNYVKGHAGIVIVGANETSNLSIISVGRINAVNQALFRNDVTYDGIADIAFVAIQSPNGKFGGLRTGNVNYFATQGFTGVYAPGVQFNGPVYIGDINAFDTATPVLVLGSVNDARITGGNLLQFNNAAVKVSGLSHLRFVNGTTSHGIVLPAQANRGRLVEDGVDITDLIVVNP